MQTRVLTNAIAPFLINLKDFGGGAPFLNAIFLCTTPKHHALVDEGKFAARPSRGSSHCSHTAFAAWNKRKHQE